MIDELKKHRCCFTGHRPHKLGVSEEKAKNLLWQAIKQAIADGYVTFISGMAQGIDIWAAEIVIEERKTNSDIHLICAVPHPNFESRRTENEKKLYNQILKQADFIKIVSEHYFGGCYQVRNEYMVDRSNRVIAAYTGEKGGTKNTIDYARKKCVEVINIFDK